MLKALIPTCIFGYLSTQTEIIWLQNVYVFLVVVSVASALIYPLFYSLPAESARRISRIDSFLRNKGVKESDIPKERERTLRLWDSSAHYLSDRIDNLSSAEETRLNLKIEKYLRSKGVKESDILMEREKEKKKIKEYRLSY
jgi:hypothetical protein